MEPSTQMKIFHNHGTELLVDLVRIGVGAISDRILPSNLPYISSIYRLTGSFKQGRTTLYLLGMLIFRVEMLNSISLAYGPIARKLYPGLSSKPIFQTTFTAANPSKMLSLCL